MALKASLEIIPLFIASIIIGKGLENICILLILTPPGPLAS